jgi:cobalt/nickel transport system permease protein
MCYRYIYLFAEIIENTYLAIKSRVGISLHYKKGQGIVASNIANLWQRSIMMNQEVYNAMLSRGYTGEPKLLHRFNTVISDWVWLFFSMAIFAALIYPTSPFNK